MLIIKIIALFLLSSAIGLLLIQVSWRLAIGRWPGWLLAAGLGLGLGAGMSACVYSLCLFIGNAIPSPRVYLSIEGVILAGLLAAWAIINRQLPNTQPETISKAPFKKGLLAGFLLALLLGLGSFLRQSYLAPLGGWDSLLIWNLHAKAIALGGGSWKNLLLYSYQAHPDYPLLVPAYVARYWRLLHIDSTYASILTSGLFTFAGLATLVAFLKEIRGWNTALAGGLILVCSMSYLSFGADQYADVPLAFFFMAALGMVLLHDIQFPRQSGLLAIAGLCAGFAVWAKNEGMLMLVALLAVRLLWLFSTRRFAQILPEAGWFLLGLAPGLLLALYYRGITPPSDLLATPHQSLVQLFTPRRYTIIWNAMNTYFVGIGKWASTSAVLVVALLGVGLGTHLKEGEGRPFAFLGLVILFVLAGYFFVYIITPYKLSWQIPVSLPRLMIHIYPALLLLCLPLIKFEPNMEN